MNFVYFGAVEDVSAGGSKGIAEANSATSSTHNSAEEHIYKPTLRPLIMLIPGLGVSYEIFLPLVELLRGRFEVVAAEVDGFTLGHHTSFTSIDDQASQIINHIHHNFNGRIDCIYGLSLGGKILSRILERGEVEVAHAIMDAAPLVALPRWLVAPLSHVQCANVWTCYHWRGFWSCLLRSHFFDALLNECHKVYPYGGGRAVIDGYKSVYTSTLQSIQATDIHYWYGSLESFAAYAQVRHLLSLHPSTRVEIFPKMNHGQLLVDHPDEVARRIDNIVV